MNSTSKFRYENDRLIYRDYQTSDNHFKHEYYYKENEVEDYFYRKYETYWRSLTRTVYQYENKLLIRVIFEEYQDMDWVQTERWSFSYIDEQYDEILMETISDNVYSPSTKIIYTYSGEYLYDYKVYNYSEDWYLTREVVFDYIDGILENIYLFYEGYGLPYGPQEKFSYEYMNDLVSRIVLSVYTGNDWLESSEILRDYDISKNMIEEKVRFIETSQNYYRYTYEYELGNKNLKVYPFYDQALYEFIYPKPSAKKSSHPEEEGILRLPVKNHF